MTLAEFLNLGRSWVITSHQLLVRSEWGMASSELSRYLGGQSKLVDGRCWNPCHCHWCLGTHKHGGPPLELFSFLGHFHAFSPSWALLGPPQWFTKWTFNACHELSALCPMLWVTKDWVSPGLQGGLLFEGNYILIHTRPGRTQHMLICVLTSVGELGGVGVLGRGWKRAGSPRLAIEPWIRHCPSWVLLSPSVKPEGWSTVFKLFRPGPTVRSVHNFTSWPSGLHI